MLEQDVFDVVSKRFDAADHMVWYITVRASCIKRPPMYINIKTWSVMRFIAPTLFVLCQDMINKLRKRVNVGNSILALQIIRLQYFINVSRGQSKIKCNNLKVSLIKLKYFAPFEQLISSTDYYLSNGCRTKENAIMWCELRYFLNFSINISLFEVLLPPSSIKIVSVTLNFVGMILCKIL